mgnify:CR=1 FL=1
MSVHAVPVTLADGKEHLLRYDFNALVQIEERLGISLDALQDKLTGPGRKLGTIRDLLWAGLLHEDASVTPESVSALIEPAALVPVTEAIAHALMASLSGEGESKNA